MDESVVQALAKWPNVPHCYGWLALDRRGRWRMRDEFAQAHGLLGDVIRHDALKAFIDRNYLSDDDGAWFFQNGPQRVFVELESTPWIVFADADGWVTQIGQRVDRPRACLIDQDGHAYLDTDAGIGLVCDRDLQVFVERLAPVDGATLDSDAIAERLVDAPETLRLTGPHAHASTPLQRIAARDLPGRYHFIAHPAAAAVASTR